ARFDEVAAGFPDPIGLGREFGLLLVLLAEVPGAAMVMLGLGTRLAALPLAATVALGAVVHHTGDPFSQREIALGHLVAYLTLLRTGPGRYSLDATIARLRRRSTNGASQGPVPLRILARVAGRTLAEGELHAPVLARRPVDRAPVRHRAGVGRLPRERWS